MYTRAQPRSSGNGARGFRISLRSVPGASFLARRRVDALAEFLPAVTLADVRTILTELVTNCVAHGSGDEIAVAVEVHEDGSVRGCVSDGGSGTIEIAGDRPPGTGGLGLRIVDALAARWGVDAPSTDVWFELAPAP